LSAIQARPSPPKEETPFRRLAIDFAQSKLAVLGLVVMALIALVALVAPWISLQNPYDLAQLDIMDGRLPPGAASGDGAMTLRSALSPPIRAAASRA
jgi:peptide/nickel transport system permease protein